MPRIVRSAMIAGLAGVLVILGWVLAGPALAAPPLPTPMPPSEAGCIGCHGETSRTITFASGETVSVDVDLAALAQSPHAPNGVTAVACLGCHDDANGHRYPHTELAEGTRREFAVRVSQACESCHYAHKPFHSPDPGEEQPATQAEPPVDPSMLPACVDCHGSHSLARVEEMRTAMPPLCIECHSDENVEWAQEFVTPRPGFGPGAADYAGSTRCNGCHDDKYFTWQKTLHARMVQDPHRDPAASVGDFDKPDPDRTFGLQDVALTVGSRWRQIYLTQTVSNTFTILPAQWNVAKQEWEPYQTTEGEATDWLQGCGSCHVTGLDAATGSFTEYSIGCESCHGPSRAHAEDPRNIKPYAQVDDQVCGSCHSRGLSPEGHPYPATYRPGDSLAAHFTPTDEAGAYWPDGSARLNHQQYTDWSLGSPMAAAPTTNCTTCHRVHESGTEPGQLDKPLNDLCLSCHSDKTALLKHIPFHEQASQKHTFVCTDCHMPQMATSVNVNDIHNHSFLQPNPDGSVKHGGVAAMPNACNLCHTDYGEDPEWAIRTISWTKALATPDSAAFFGPGPTPTSPPPPTPIQSVGRPVEVYEVPTGRGLRIGFFVTVGLLGVLIAGLVARALLKRREQHA